MMATSVAAVATAFLGTCAHCRIPVQSKEESDWEAEQRQRHCGSSGKVGGKERRSKSFLGMCAHRCYPLQSKEESEWEAEQRHRHRGSSGKVGGKERQDKSRKKLIEKQRNECDIAVCEEKGLRRVGVVGDDGEVVKEHEEAVWRRCILLGERCEPPSFSGVILYDQSGNRVQQLPWPSPRRRPPSPSLRQLMAST
ncbi:hypothetical protein KP509_1Z115200 [Ceratopteris richardii]|nr:hypothetical protein KP509_1Z115200 [Ceratopteris richardii]